MKTIELKVAQIGNSRGVRLPADSLKRYRIGATVMMEERTDGILLRPTGEMSSRLSWEETAREMVGAKEDWAEWNAVAADGLESIPWEPAQQTLKVAEEPTIYRTGKPKGRRK